MSEIGAGIKEQEKGVELQPRIIDVRRPQYQYHWAPIKSLEEILSKGLYSEDFAKRIRDVNFKRRFLDPHNVHVLEYMSQTWHFPLNEAVVIVVDILQREATSLRIGPRQFVGLMIPDERWLPNPHREDQGVLAYVKDIITMSHEIDRLKLTKPFVSRRVNQVKGILGRMGQKTPNLAIYGTSGDLYWPRRMAHEEIVGMLAERKPSEI